MKVKLTIIDRLTLVGVFFPEKTDLLEMTLIMELEQKLKISSDELIKVEFNRNTGAVNAEKNDKQIKDFDLSEVEITLITKRIEELNKTKQITRQIMNVHKRFK